MSFAKDLESKLNVTRTGNGDVTYKTSLNNNLDLFYLSGGVRGSDYYEDIATKTEDLVIIFKKAYEESPELALRNLLNIRDIRHGGKGERDLFVTLLNSLIPAHTQVVKNLIYSGAVSELGRWDDLVKLFALQMDKGTEESYFVCSAIASVFVSELDKINEEYSSLLPKWLPTNTRNVKTYKVAKKLATFMGFDDFRDYRKTVSALRKPLNLVESNLSQRDYGKIEVSHIPSAAFKKYQTALWRCKESQMEAFLDAVQSGEKKVKTTGLTPDEIVHSIDEVYDDNNLAFYEETWKRMVAETRDIGNTLVIADVSGSMTGKPMEVSVGLALLFAEAMKGDFHNTFMTFSGHPSLVHVAPEMSLRDKLYYIRSSDWGFNTDIDAAFQTILDTAISNKTAPEELPERLVIISDMQFDSSVVGEPHIKRWKETFTLHGYKLPTVVYWNVSSYSNVPATGSEEGVALVSGFTKGTLNAVLNAEEITPEKIMTEALMSPEYDFAEVALSKH